MIKRLTNYIGKAAAFVHQHPMFIFFCLGLLYLFFFQRNFLYSGDVWAETHMEYLQEALTLPASDIFQPGWAGYLTIVPTFFTKLYVYLQFPIGYIDYYFRFITVISALFCCAIVASKFMSGLYQNTYFRLLLALSVLMLLSDKSTFTLINVWYLGFIPLALLCLNHQKLSVLMQALYALFGVLIALTKPSIILLPFLLYRAIKTKEYISNGIIAIAVTYQAYAMLFLDLRGSAGNASKDLLYVIRSVYAGTSTELFKLFNIFPTHVLYLLAGNLLLLGLTYLIYKKLGFIRTGLLIFALAFSVYAYVLAPDAILFTHISDYKDIYLFNFKVQREFLIYAYLLTIILTAGYYAVGYLKNNREVHTRALTPSVIFTSMALLFIIFKPIDVTSAGVAANIEPFRHQLNGGQSSCVPIPPTPRYFPNANWMFEFNTVCHPRNFEKNPDFENMTIDLREPVEFVIKNDVKLPLKTMYFSAKNNHPHQTARVTLTDEETEVSYTGIIPGNNKEKLHFFAIPIASLPAKDTYTFSLKSDYEVTWGTFKGTDEPIVYPYFAEDKPLFSRQ